jgi:putative phage-type endonuclease
MIKIVKFESKLYEMDLGTGHAWRLTKAGKRDKRQVNPITLLAEEVEILGTELPEEAKAPKGKGKNEMIAKKLFNVTEHSEEYWLEQRTKYITGSDAAAILNASKYKGKVVVYNEKKKGYKQPIKEPAFIEWGHIMEPVLRKKFAVEMNKKRAKEGLAPIRVQQNNFMLVHPEYDYLAANIDGEVFHPERGHGLLEIKTASEYVKDEWEGEDIPNEYLLQVHHYMLVTGLKFAYVAVLIGGNKFKIKFIPRDEEIITLLFEAEKHFYEQHLVRNIPPVMDGHSSTKDMLNAQYPQSNNFVKHYLNENFIAQIENIAEAKARIEEWTSLKTRAENLIKGELKQHEEAYCGPYKVTWKTDKRGVKSMRITQRKEPKRKKSKVDPVKTYHNNSIGGY